MFILVSKYMLKYTLTILRNQDKIIIAVMTWNLEFLHFHLKINMLVIHNFMFYFYMSN